MNRLFTTCITLAMAVAFILGVFALSSAEAKDPKPCTSKTFKFKKVEAACKEGGQKAAKKLMKGIVKAAKKAKDANVETCLDCHEDFKTFKRKANAVAWLKPYLK